MKRVYDRFVIQYHLPPDWLRYSPELLLQELTEAKAAVMSLRSLPYQRRWVDNLQAIQLKREVAGTSKIEGADFTDRELDVALKETPEQLLTRSQRQAHAAAKTYRWIKTVPDERPVSCELVCIIHRMIVENADDDHCPPGVIRAQDQNVLFGNPRHRGAEGGSGCEKAFMILFDAVSREFKGHDPLIQALALHYHFAAMHPFLDGNGRTARVLEALMLQRAGLRNTLFIAMSNYYYDEKTTYLQTLSEVRAKDHDLTAFLAFALKGISLQCQRLFNEIKMQVQKSLFSNLMLDLFTRLKNPRRRIIGERQIEILKILLEVEEIEFEELQRVSKRFYASVGHPRKAIVRDINELGQLEAISVTQTESKQYLIMIRLDWPTRITESSFFEQVQRLPTAKTGGVLLQANLDYEKSEAMKKLM